METMKSMKTSQTTKFTKSLTDLIQAYKTLGKEGYILTINDGSDGSKPTAVLNRISKRSKAGYKKVFGYRFRDMKRLEEYCTEYYNKIVKLNQEAQNQKIKKKEQDIIDRDNVKVGDIFYYSWGFEQTNVEFYQVTSKKGKASITIRPIYSETVESLGWASESCRACPNDFIGDSEETVRLSGKYFKRDYGSALKMEDKNEIVYRSWYA